MQKLLVLRSGRSLKAKLYRRAIAVANNRCHSMGSGPQWPIEGSRCGAARWPFQRLQGLTASRQILCNGVAFADSGWIVGIPDKGSGQRVLPPALYEWRVIGPG